MLNNLWTLSMLYSDAANSALGREHSLSKDGITISGDYRLVHLSK